MRAKAEEIIDEITGLLYQLSSVERRVLQRRLRVSGLLETEELLADRNRLDVATALGVQVADSMASKRVAAKRMAEKEMAEKAMAEQEVAEQEVAEQALSNPVSTPRADHFTDAPALAERETFTEPFSSSTHETSHLSPAIDSAERPAGMDEAAEAMEHREFDEAHGYQSAISGKVVVGAPSHLDSVPDPHMMSPLPGQAPENPIRVVFDGGSKGNPGAGYGSYALDWPGLPRQIVQLQFGNHVTNNEAEYDTLIAALEGIITRLEDQEVDLSTAQLDIRGDSELVIKQVHGEYQCKSNRMRLRRDRVVELLEEFEDWALTHHGREHSVRILGH